MQIIKRKFKCFNHDCIKPAGRRLGLFQANDDFECYAESYVKCFWGMCDRHKSIEDFTKRATGVQQVITTQPLPRTNIKTLTLRNPTLNEVVCK